MNSVSSAEAVDSMAHQLERYFGNMSTGNQSDISCCIKSPAVMVPSTTNITSGPSRMAMELPSRNWSSDCNEEVRVADSHIWKSPKSTFKRLLKLGAGKRKSPNPTVRFQCLNPIMGIQPKIGPRPHLRSRDDDASRQRNWKKWLNRGRPDLHLLRSRF